MATGFAWSHCHATCGPPHLKHPPLGPPSLGLLLGSYSLGLLRYDYQFVALAALRYYFYSDYCKSWLDIRMLCYYCNC